MAKGASKVSGGKLEGYEPDRLSQAEEFFGYSWWEKLTTAEQIAVYNYTDTGYRSINKFLRTGKDGSPEIDKSIRDIDSAIAKSVIHEPVVVKRGCSGAMFGLPDDRKPTVAELQQFVGRSFTDKGFVSTSAGGNVFLDTLTLKITVPSGRGRGGYIGTESAHGSESELLLKRGARYRVTGVDSNGVVSIQML